MFLGDTYIAGNGYVGLDVVSIDGQADNRTDGTTREQQPQRTKMIRNRLVRATWGPAEVKGGGTTPSRSRVCITYHP